MKTILRFAALLVGSLLGAFGQPTPPANITVMANKTTGALVVPTNFFSGSASGNFVSSLTGTTGQVTVSAATGAVTLSLPTSITGVNSLRSVAGQDLTLGTGTTGTALTFTSATNAATFSQGLLSFTGATTLTGGAGNMTITSGTGNSRTLALQTTTGAGTATTFLTGGADQSTTLAGNLIGVGSTNALNVAAGVTPFTEFEVDSTSTSSPRGIMSAQFSTSTDGARLRFRKARGTRASPTTVVTGDAIGRLAADAFDGTTYVGSTAEGMASILFTTEGTVATNRTPTTIQFWTATDAAPSVLTLAGKFDSAQRLTLTNNLTMAGAITGANSVTSASATDLTLTGNGGASLVLGQGANGAVTVTPAGTGPLQYTSSGATAAQMNFKRATATTTNGAAHGFLAFYNGATEVCEIDSVTPSGTVNDNGALDFYTKKTATAIALGMRLSDTQNLLVGTTTDISGAGGLKVAGSTASTSTTTGALQVVGGAGIGGAAYIGGSTNISGTTLCVNPTATGATGVITMGDTLGTNNVGIWRGANNGAPGTGGNFLNLGGYGGMVFTTGAAVFGSQTKALEIDTSQRVLINATTDASSTSTGSLQTLGGLGVTKKAFFGDYINIRTSTAQAGIDIGATQANQATIYLRATDVGSVDWKIYRNTSNALLFDFNGTGWSSLSSAGVLSLSATTASTSTTTGACIISGGLGVAGAGWFGSTITATTASGSDNGGLILATNSSNGTVGIRAQNTNGALQGNANLSMRKSNNTANARIADFSFGDGGVLSGRFLNDAENAATSWVTVTGTSAAISSIVFGPATSGALVATTVGHLATQGTAPTAVVGAAAGTTPSAVTITGHDGAFLCTLTTGTSCPSSGVIATVTFNTAFAATPHPVFSAGGPNAALAAAKVYATATTTTCVLNAAAALTDATAYTWELHVIQ